MATRERNRTRDRSKSSDISGEPSLAATAAAAQTRPAPNGPHRLASGHIPTGPAASTAGAPSAQPLPQAPSPPLHLNAADLLVAAAAAVNRADALQRAEASESDVSPRARQRAPHLADVPKRRKERDAERRARKDRGLQGGGTDEDQLPRSHEELRGNGDAAKLEDAPAFSGQEVKRPKRKVGSNLAGAVAVAVVSTREQGKTFGA